MSRTRWSDTAPSTSSSGDGTIRNGASDSWQSITTSRMRDGVAEGIAMITRWIA